MKNLIKKINYWSSEKYVEIFRPQSFVQTILLHKIYPSRKDVIPFNGTISEGLDVSQFEYFIRYFTRRSFRFIDETDILAGNLRPDEKYIYLTFDDGYYNNFYALEILKKYKAKATFYISTNHIEEEKSFWWDVQFRERSKEERSTDFIRQEVKEMHKLNWKEQEDYLISHFGHNALVPLNDLDRPMSRNELKEFSKHESVYLGNHTHNHLNTTIYTKQEIKESITTAEKYIEEISQKPVQSIAYPYGYYNDQVLETMAELKYKIGVTVDGGKNSIEEVMNDKFQLRLKRCQLSGFFDMQTQLHQLNSGFSFIQSLKSTGKKKV